MPKIGRFPPFGKRFFRRLRKQFGAGNFEHFWRLIIGIASMPGRKSLSRIRRLFGRGKTRQAMAYFLNQALWDAPDLLQQKALDTLRQLGYRPGQELYAVLDDTQKRKRGKRMEAVSKLFLHAERLYAPGHTIVGCALVYRDVLIPYAVDVWASRTFCQQSQTRKDPRDRLTFRKLTQMGADLLRQIHIPGDGRVIALFDSYYLCPVVTAACQECKWPFVSVAKKNRNFAPDGRAWDKRKIGRYGKNVLARDGRWQKVSGKEHRLAERVGRLSKAGRVKLVFSSRRREKSWVSLVTNETCWSVSTVLRHYLHRWPIEVLFKMSKQYLGLGDYQVLRYRGVVRYLHLVMIAYLWLTHLALTEPSAQTEIQGEGVLRLPSVPQLQEQLRKRLWDDVIESMEQGTRYRSFAQKLKQLIEL